ncbi:FAD-dependent oxidoreductase [Nonomuraea sp. K274]|uniref:FAD-dependent oxidoreductase n=1 Tax=Nonomuraea cypriaca TaxID=1187855 RepID=A0A931F0Z0_9ACTN|nr:FAD-dependent oxidoreductase [Nonomuraea cypriaca]MBF8189950.1 FAD-dependent oxidoreductase [Nonomuraea cypriaca]
MYVRDTYDVAVAGGGTAGAVAAIAAARTGARTLLVERYGTLGGALALGMNLLGAADGEGYWALGGIGRELVERLRPAGGATAASTDPQFGSVLAQDPEVLKLHLLDLAVGAGVELLLHTTTLDVVQGPDGPAGVRVVTKRGIEFAGARVLVDCTGDADLAASAGAGFTVGRASDRRTQPASRIFRVGGVNMEAVWDYLRHHPDDLEPPKGWTGGRYDVERLRATPGATIEAFGALIKRARAAGDWTIPRYRLGLYTLPGRHDVGVNVTRTHGVDGTDPDDLTRAEVETSLQMLQVVAFLRGYVPGFEEAHIVSTPYQVGIRETRHVRGGYVLEQDDVLSGRDFADQVGRGAYPLDVHDVDARRGGSVLRPIRRSFGIPMRCLLPEGVSRLVVGGRPISATHEAAGSIRGQAVCMVTGHAAGVIAALAAKGERDTHDLDPDQVRATLREQGALLERGEHIDQPAPDSVRVLDPA